MAEPQGSGVTIIAYRLFVLFVDFPFCLSGLKQCVVRSLLSSSDLADEESKSHK